MKQTPSASPLLVVDLDGSLLKSDILWEQIITFIKRWPLQIVTMLSWLWRGKVYFKEQLTTRVLLNLDRLPFNSEVLDRIQSARAAGMRIVLATASHKRIAEQVALHLGLFDDVIATVDKNLKGHAKYAALQQRYPEQPFTYVGDAAEDIELWRHAQCAILVRPSKKLHVRAQQACTKVEIIQAAMPAQQWFKQLRPHQWVKNVLVFVPLLAAHRLTHINDVLIALRLFVAFSLTASAVYILNDVLDLDVDRSHPRKRLRPLAAGNLSVGTALLSMPILIFVALCCILGLSVDAFNFIAAYLALNIMYSFRLKHVLVVDVALLTLMYTLRIFAGAAAIDVPLSQWLISFAAFFFFGLAIVKRFVEARQVSSTSTFRAYRASDENVLLVIGVASSLISVLVFDLYLASPEVRALYRFPWRLWPVTLVIVYWLSRTWILAARNELGDDPVVYASSDRASWMCLVLLLAFCWAAV